MHSFSKNSFTKWISLSFSKNVLFKLSFFLFFQKAFVYLTIFLRIGRNVVCKPCIYAYLRLLLTGCDKDNTINSRLSGPSYLIYYYSLLLNCWGNNPQRVPKIAPKPRGHPSGAVHNVSHGCQHTALTFRSSNRYCPWQGRLKY